MDLEDLMDAPSSSADLGQESTACGGREGLGVGIGNSSEHRRDSELNCGAREDGVEESGGIEEERLTVLGIETGVGVGTGAGIGTEVGTEREIGTGERTGTGTQGVGGMDRGNGTSIRTTATTGAGVRTRSTATGTPISRTSMRGGTEAEERRRRQMGTSGGARGVEQTQGGGGGVGTEVGTGVGTTVQDTNTGGRVGQFHRRHR
jgi:hypothetical protein